MIGAGFDALLAAARRGDESAFGALWRDAHPWLLRYLTVLVGDDADDVAGETWLSVVRSLAGFSGDEDAWRCWLFTLARRRATDHLRRRGRRPVVLAFPDDGGDDTIGGDVADDALDNLDTRRAIELIATLPRLQAEVLMLRVVAGLEVAQVAAILGRSRGAVRVASHRGLRTLAAVVSKPTPAAVGSQGRA